MRSAWMVAVCLVIGCHGAVVEQSGGGGAAGSEPSGGTSGAGGAGGTASTAGGAGGESTSSPPPELCGPMVPAAPELKCYGTTQCDDKDTCTADRCSPAGLCCHSVIGNCP